MKTNQELRLEARQAANTTFFTTDELRTIATGGTVDKENSAPDYSGGIYFSLPYRRDADGLTHIVYSADRLAYGSRAGVLALDHNRMRCRGLLFCGAYFDIGGMHAIQNQIAANVSDRIRARVPHEDAAERFAKKYFAGGEAYRLDRVKDLEMYDFDCEARNAIADGDALEDFDPAAKVSNKDFDEYDVIEYLEDPQAVVETEAQKYIEAKADHIYYGYAYRRKVREAVEAYKADAVQFEALSLLLRLSDTAEASGAKTLTLRLSYGATVHVEARAVIALKYQDPQNAYISAGDAAAKDRAALRLNEYGHAAGIRPREIVEITYKGRTIYLTSEADTVTPAA